MLNLNEGLETNIVRQAQDGVRVAKEEKLEMVVEKLIAKLTESVEKLNLTVSDRMIVVNNFHKQVQGEVKKHYKSMKEELEVIETLLNTEVNTYKDADQIKAVRMLAAEQG